MTATADVPRLPHRVTIVGGGFAGLYAAKSLGIDPEVRLTLVDRRNFHLFQPMLYQVATGALSPGDIAQPLRSILRKQRNTTVILGEAIGIDPERREVLLADGGPIAYDTLIVATGAHHTYFDHPEWASIAPGLKTLEDATEIRRRILIAFEAAEREADPERRKAWMTFVLVGGGPTGVELAGAARRDRPRHAQARLPVDPVRARPGSSSSRRWIGSCRRIRPVSPASAQRQLERLGVEVRTSTRVVDLHEDGVRVTGADGTEETIPARTIFWAAGVLSARFARTVAEATGAATDRSGRVIVEPDLTIPGHPEIFVVGDAAVEPWKPGKPTPGRRTGRDAGRVVRGEGRPPADPRPAVRAVPVQRPRRRRGHRPAGGGHQHQLARARSGSRAGSPPGCCGSGSTSSISSASRTGSIVLIRWAWTFVTHGRGTRLITGSHLLPPIVEPEPPVMAPLDPEVEMTAGTAIGAAGRLERRRWDGCPEGRGRRSVTGLTVSPRPGPRSGRSCRPGPSARPGSRRRSRSSSSRAIVRPSPSPVGRPVAGSVARATSAR